MLNKNKTIDSKFSEQFVELSKYKLLEKRLINAERIINKLLSLTRKIQLKHGYMQSSLNDITNDLNTLKNRKYK